MPNSPVGHANSSPANSLPLKILVADDSETERLILSTILRKQHHTVITASNGLEAVQLFQQERPAMVLLDALMPEMDGFEAAEKIKQLAGEDFIPVLFLTSLQEADSLVRCLEAGGDDFLPKPYNSVVLGAKINAFMRMREMHLTLQNQRDEIANYNRHLLWEQEVAKRVFDKVAHAGCLEADNIQYELSPIAVFNGDVVLAGVGPAGNLLVLLGDFTGHGLNAAIGAMPLAQTFYSMLEKGFGLKQILREINLKLNEVLPLEIFCCALVAEINFNNGEMHVWNGGLPDCLLYHATDGSLSPLKSRHLPLGISANRTFNDALESYEVLPGDRLFIWSDGIHEAENDLGERYGEQRLWSVFEQNSDPSQLFDAINSSVKSFISADAPGDDVSLLEVLVVRPEQFKVAVPEYIGGRELGPRDWSFKFELRPETLKYFDPLPLLLHILMEVPFLRSRGSQIYTVLSELYSNALEHGVLQLDSSLKDSSDGFSEYYRLREQRLQYLSEGSISIGLQYRGDDSGGSLRVDFEDSGRGFEYQPLLNGQHMAAWAYSGRGIQLLQSLCQSIDYSGPGNQVSAVLAWREQEN